MCVGLNSGVRACFMNSIDDKITNESNDGGGSAEEEEVGQKNIKRYFVTDDEKRG